MKPYFGSRVVVEFLSSYLNVSIMHALSLLFRRPLLLGVEKTCLKNYVVAPKLIFTDHQ